MHKKIELNEEEYTALYNYLILRPYKEVADFLFLLNEKIKEQIALKKEE